MNPQLTEQQLTELQTSLTEIKGGWAQVKDLPATVKTLQDENSRLSQHVTDLRRQLLSRAHQVRAVRPPGQVSDECATFLGATFVAQCLKSGRIEALCSHTLERDALVDSARKTLDLTTRAALSTNEVPLPVQYAGEIRELISEFGVVRRQMTRYPIGMGTAKPARMGTRPAFASVAMSAAVPDVVPSLTFASLDSHKVGGVVRLPREIDEQSIVAMGHFLARYGPEGPTPMPLDIALKPCFTIPMVLGDPGLTSSSRIQRRLALPGAPQLIAMKPKRIGFAALICGCFIFAACASTSVQVVKLEESYRVWIETTGRHWEYPLSPEGPFPKWSECSVFVLKGPGIPTNGTSQYLIGKDAIGWGAYYRSGYINFDEKNKVLELRAVNQAGYRNQSGIYKKCKFEAPVIHSVTNYASLANYTSNHAIVKITGFLHDNSRCKIDGGIVYLGGYFQVGPKYEFIGWTETGADEISMSVYDFKVIR